MDSRPSDEIRPKRRNNTCAIALMIGSVWVSHTPTAVGADEPPIDIAVTYVADVLTNTRGGLKTGTAYLDDIRISATVDMDRALGLEGGTLLVSGRRFNSSDFNGRLGGEFQKISNIDTEPGTRLYEAWYQHAFAADRLTLKGGLYDLNSEFDVNTVGIVFLNSSHGIGTDFGQTGQNGPSIFPVTSLAGRIAWQDPSGLTLKAAVLDGIPGDPAFPNRTAIKLANGDGALITAEIGYAWEGGQVYLGGWNYTARFDDLIATTPTGDALRRGGNRGGYGLLSSQLLQSDDGPTVEGFVRVGVAQPSINTVARYIGVGLTATGLIRSRRDDVAGISVASAHSGKPFQRAGSNAGMPVTTHETIIEATYRANLTPWLSLQPDLQYVIHPGFDPTLKNSVIVGLRFEISPSEALRR